MKTRRLSSFQARLLARVLEAAGAEWRRFESGAVAIKRKGEK